MKAWVNIIPCVVLSSAIWLIHNLSQEYADIASVPVLAESNLAGRAARAGAEVVVTARVQTTGYKLAGLRRRHVKPRVVTLDPIDLEHADGDFYTISNNALYKYANSIFGEGVTIESFVADEIRFKFARESFKKVPVTPVVNLSYKPQYMALKEMTFEPDSVLVYAEPSRLETIDAILTRPVSLSDLHASVHGVARVDAPAGARLSQNEVAYSLEVTRYIEFRRTFPVEVRNAPRKVRVSVIPAEATATFRCVFPMTSDPSEKVALYVDYADFTGSLDGSCVVRTAGVPGSVISCEVDPQVCVCVEVE